MIRKARTQTGSPSKNKKQSKTVEKHRKPSPGGAARGKRVRRHFLAASLSCAPAAEENHARCHLMPPPTALLVFKGPQWRILN